jgi:hypothetical protein
VTRKTVTRGSEGGDWKSGRKENSLVAYPTACTVLRGRGRGNPSLLPGPLASRWRISRNPRLGQIVSQCGRTVNVSLVTNQKLCGKSTLQLFRVHLVQRREVRTLFEQSAAEAHRAGLLKRWVLRIALDTKPILGRGAVEDTYSLLATGIQLLECMLRSPLDAH